MRSFRAIRLAAATVAIAASAGLSMVACSTTSTPPTNELPNDDAGPYVDVPPSSTPTSTLDVGGAVPVAPGAKVGYALTATAPKTYQLRWTGDAKVAADGFQHFYGSVWTTGHFTSYTPGCLKQACPLEPGDVLSMAPMQVSGGERIDWSTSASTGWDGFGFTTDAEPIYFDVYVDGTRRPDLFFFAAAPSGATTSPATSPFGITSAGVTDGGADGH